MKPDYQALLFRVGAEVPLRIEDWRLESYCIRGDIESGMFVFARYRR
jgi:hypothetical protein